MPTNKYKNPLNVNKIYLEESVAQFLSKWTGYINLLINLEILSN